MKQTLLFIAVVLLAASCRENFDARYAREAREYTQKYCPIQKEEHNTLDSTVYDIPTRTYYHYYTLSGPWAAAQSIENLQGQSEILRGHLIEELNNSIEWKGHKENGITFAYVYRSAASGEPVLNIRLTAKDYNH